MNASEAIALLHPHTLTTSWDRPSARDWARVLGAFPLFSGVSKRRLRKLVRNATFAEFAAGDTIQEGAASLNVILGGSARPVRARATPALGVGDYFGRPIVATQELHVLKLPKRSIPALVFSQLEQQDRRLDRAERDLACGSTSRVECLQDQLRALVAQRQELHEHQADRDELESNRLELASRQRELSQAFIDRHVPDAEREAA